MNSWTSSILLSLFLNLSATNAMAGATNCNCPSTDPMAKASCGPMPKKFTRDIYKEEACATSCNATTGIGAAAAKAAQWSTEALAKMETMKTPKEGLKYFSCYRSDEKKFCHYKNTVGPLIKLAADSSDLPFAVQACLFRRESGFSPDAKSPVGALGYVQFMPSILPGIKDLLYNDVAAMTKTYQHRENAIAENERLLKLEKDKTSSKAVAVKKKINSLESQNKVLYSKIAAKRAWDEYWEGTPKKPNIASISTASLSCPQLAFALAAVAQSRTLHSMSKIDVNVLARPKGKRVASINGMNEQDSAILLAGAYNMGPAGLASKCGTVKSVQECINKVGNAETRKHLESIRNCSTKQNWNGPSFDSKGKPVNRDCSKISC